MSPMMRIRIHITGRYDPVVNISGPCVQEEIAACLARAEELEQRQQEPDEEYLCFQVR